MQMFSIVVNIFKWMTYTEVSSAITCCVSNAASDGYFDSFFKSLFKKQLHVFNETCPKDQLCIKTTCL